MFKGLEHGWNEVSEMMARDSKRLSEVFQRVSREDRIQAAE